VRFGHGPTDAVRGCGRLADVAPQLETVLYERDDDGVIRLTLNRPDRLNAMNHQLVADLHTALDGVHDDEAARVVILTGAGRAFCAGLDLKDGATVPVPDGTTRGRVQAGLATQRHIATLIPHLRSLRVPVIAAVNGAATGGGLALALGSDIRLASTAARFGVAFVRIGLSGCDIGVSWALPRLIGASRAHELMLTGRIIDAEESERIGLVSRVVEPDDLDEASTAIAGMIVANSPFGIEMTKEAMWSALEIPSQRAAIDVENRQQILASMTGDMSEAVAAFLEKRPPEFGNT
jgi:enoyl-CoA hydratase